MVADQWEVAWTCLVIDCTTVWLCAETIAASESRYMYMMVDWAMTRPIASEIMPRMAITRPRYQKESFLSGVQVIRMSIQKMTPATTSPAATARGHGAFRS